MTSNVKRGVVLAAGLLLAGGAALGARPDLVLSLDLRDGRVHDPNHPLLVTVTLANSAASRAASDNRSREAGRAQLKASTRFEALSQEERERIYEQLEPREVETFELGSAQDPLASLIRFTIAPADRGAIDVPVVGLGRNDTADATVVLDERSSVALFFGVTPESLGRLEPGEYTIRARLDTADRPDMWQGVVDTRAESFRLGVLPESVPPAERAVRAFLAGLYYRVDGDYDRVATWAARATELDPGYPGGWELLGDVQAARGDPAGAAEHYTKAIELFDVRKRREFASVEWSEGNPPWEPPLQIHRKLEALLSRIQPAGDPPLPTEPYRPESEAEGASDRDE